MKLSPMTLNEVRIEWTLKECRNKRRTNKARTKLTETTLITPTSIHTSKTKHQAIVLKLIFKYCNTWLQACRK